LLTNRKECDNILSVVEKQRNITKKSK
jgi:hypothetical protein